MAFKKGESGNPNGRNKVTTQMKRLARDLLTPHQGKATQAIVDCLSSDDDNTKLAAAKVVYDYCFGKPAQAVELTGEEGGPLNIMINLIKDKQ